MIFKRLVCFLSLALVFSGCRKEAFDDFYGRPDWLADPIYQQLKARKNFDSFLTCIDKAGYKDILSSAGYWTIFAPNDDAFQKYFEQKGISKAGDIPEEAASAIVRYSLVYNAFKTDHLADVQGLSGWDPGMAFKRRTTFYRGALETEINNQNQLVVSSNRNNRVSGGYYVKEDNNNKYIPYFLNNYFAAKGLSESDYKYFYPSSDFTGFNVAQAAVVNKDIIAENGVIHEINSVIEPLPNIDEYLGQKPEYSGFKAIFDKFMVSYLSNADATAKYQQISGTNKSVLVKVFNSGLSYSPNNENFLKFFDNDGQGDGFSMFAPSNEALNKYLSEVLLEHYQSLDNLPLEVLFDFLNAHMWATTVWPGKFSSTLNGQGQGALFDPQTDITDKKVLSNGVFYGTNKVQEANVFSSVFGKAYLDPRYSLMTRALSVSLKPSIINTNLKYTLFLVSDEALKTAGFIYNLDANRWEYKAPGGGTTITGTGAWTKLSRILNLHLINEDVTSLGGSGIAETYGGEYIRYAGSRVFSKGNQEKGEQAVVNTEKTASNGTVYYLDRLLLDPEKLIGTDLKDLGTASGSQFSKFFNYLNNSQLYNKNSGEILGVTAGSQYTILVPGNTAITQAIAEGYLPSAENPSAQADKDKVNAFIRYHIIQKATVVPDGKKEGGFTTLLQNGNGDATLVTVTNHLNSMQIKDMTGATVNVVLPSSNNLSNNAVIHLLDGFLKFNVQ
ncbi:fasciclin domain-containing protein [Pararcticibacter amylolyticus]|uniref:FAS1 domain-containing protein n=1 Tax=Pararcticibacter amylolyticus TaxID=2173175 RepID=A0A2U2PC75_9SPHI|nr:fasciclin domain-containing protein [Pararcticibacter amylolyticus]PWG78997.1 hypothetical protein DDR33_19305 [Pararcticibacter amylolyticus]